MSDEDIAKLAARLTKSLATKEDIKDLKTELKADLKRLDGKIDEVDKNVRTVLEFAEAVDETTTGLDKRLRAVERIPAIAHQIKKAS